MSNVKSEQEYLSQNYYGVDYEEDSYYTVDDSNEGKDYSQLRREIILQKDQYSVEYICGLIKTAYLDLSPEFQRNEVWQDNKRKSLFIESILLNIPIPIFYAYNNDEELLSIIDGKQRLSTIRDFRNNSFQLSNLHHLKQFNNLKYCDLPEKVRLNFDRYQCSFYILNYMTPKRYIFDIFMRINTGSVPLTTQEIRNIFAKPKVRELLKRMSTCIEFRKVTRQKINDTRMDAQEMALRFIALRKNYDFTQDKFVFTESSLSELLDRTIAELNQVSEQELLDYFNLFKFSCVQSYELLNDKAFSRLKMHHGKILPKSNTINKSLFSAFTVLLTNERYKYADLKSASMQVIEEFFILQDGKIVSSILASSTGSKKNLNDLFYYINNLLKEYINVN